MNLLLKKFLFYSIYNLTLFLLLIIGIQNSDQKKRIFFFNKETIELPTSFIVGLSFISGSIVGSLFNFNSGLEKITRKN